MMLFLCLPLSISIIRPSDPPRAILTLPLLLFHTSTYTYVHGVGGTLSRPQTDTTAYNAERNDILVIYPNMQIQQPHTPTV